MLLRLRVETARVPKPNATCNLGKGALGHPRCGVAVIFQTRRTLQRVLVGIHDQIPLIVFLGHLHPFEWLRKVFVAYTEKTPDPND